MEPTIAPQGFVQPSMTITCPVCHYTVQDTWYFCPNCGKKLKKTPLSTSLGKQLQVYSASIFLPPFGVIPAFRYLAENDGNAKLVGIVCLLLTILSCIITVWSTIYLINLIQSMATQTLDPLSSLQY